MSLDRRDFVRLLAASLVPPSMVWPFRKIFLPPLWSYHSFTLTCSNPWNFKVGDRVQIYRCPAGGSDYYLVKEITATTGVLMVTEIPSPAKWLNLDRHDYDRR